MAIFSFKQGTFYFVEHSTLDSNQQFFYLLIYLKNWL